LNRETPEDMDKSPEEQFVLEQLPTKMIMIPPTHTEMTMLVQHSEAVYAVRKMIIEKAKLFWKD
jgi:hypothetical protein